MAATDDDISLREYIDQWQQLHAQLHEVHLRAHEAEHLGHDRVHVAEAVANGSQVETATVALDHRLTGLNDFHDEMRRQFRDSAPRTVVDRLDIELRGLASIFAPLQQVERLDADTDRRLLEMSTEIAVLRSQNDRLQGIVGVARFLGAGGLFAAIGALILFFTKAAPV